jgi:hypothetical protein
VDDADLIPENCVIDDEGLHAALGILPNLLPKACNTGVLGV